MTARVKNFRDLIVWQRSMQLAEEVYGLAPRLPASERFGLATQMRRAAVSIPSNIAEGHGRKGPREFLHFLGIANGSLTELETQLLLANRLGQLTSADLTKALNYCAEISRMLSALRKSLRARPLSPNP